MSSSDQNITCEQLADNIRPFMRRHMLTLFVMCLGIAIWMFMSEKQGIMAFVVISAGAMLPIIAWNSQNSGSLPLGPLMGIQSLIIYGTPLVAQNPSVFDYPAEEVLRSAIEIFIFCAGMAGAWVFAFKNSFNTPPRTYLKFKFIHSAEPKKLVPFGILLMSISIGYHAADMSGLLGFIPTGVRSILRTIGDSAGMGGGLLSGYLMGVGALAGMSRIVFWIMFLIHCVFTSSNYTLFPVTALVISVSVGLFLGRGKVPLVFLAIFTVIIGFFNLSKFEMRKGYWMEGAAYAPQEISDLPSRYFEWTARSWGHFTNSEEYKLDRERIASQRIADRINNLVNLLDVQEYVTKDNIPVLGGETYTGIPVLLIPRILWPNKPRTHEGMVILNVHFGKQTLEETFVTYISWGLLPEAYGNFGPVFGALACGCVMGLMIGWLEAWSRHYPIVSLQALLYMSLLVQFGSSFEMVASLWITSIFQMLVAMCGGSLIFVEKSFFPSPDS